MEDREKAEERHLLRQIDKIAALMARGGDTSTPESTRQPKAVALPPVEAKTSEVTASKGPLPGAQPQADGTPVPITLLEDPTALVGLSSLHSEDATFHKR